MRKTLQHVTDWVSTRKGAWITLIIWILAMVILTVAVPSVREYQVTSVATLPEDMQSVIANDKIEEYFGDSELLPAILVLQSDDEVQLQDLVTITDAIIGKDFDGLKEIVPMGMLPEPATNAFFSEDRTTAIIPANLDSNLDTKQVKVILQDIAEIVNDQTDLTLSITGPAGIAVDTTDLFTRADVVLILATVGIILVLLIVIYRSPLIALIPLLAAVFVYQVVTQLLGLFGKAGLLMSTQSVSIMSVLLFAAVIDYSLFVFSRYREELKHNEDKHSAMKVAMRGTGLPVFYSGGTVLLAMLILIFANLGDYKNFAPIFGAALVVIMVSSVTLVPALFTLFGRKSFWPVVPKVGDTTVKPTSIWSKIGRFVTNKPVVSILIIGVFILVSASYNVNLKYEFDLIKSFPEDMPSRVGYEALEEKFAPGDLAATTVLVESNTEISEENRQALIDELLNQDYVDTVRIDNQTEDGKVLTYSLTFENSPYAIESINALELIQEKADEILDASNIDGTLYFAGETASSLDDQNLNDRDLIVIVLLETILIFIMLIFLTKSIKMPIYMMGTILVSFFAALGLGMFLTNLFFGIDTISNRVPVYAFIFLVALGIDYNIILVSRFLEERERHSVKEAVQIAVASTGGVISSAGIILAATFAVLMTQPIQLLFVFGFIVAVGILIDTFLIRGVLLPSLIVLLEKDKKKKEA
ncbi:MMPL family transporter [Ureibacillus acetophenoni]|uniref:RND superfamily putative drug exporter n=1 Tax=Ureibacillus acetophenoni TaxID=614649 RepID=A0A285UAV7_9BACL|nr:MMPL family transporter [Ureibacillus acetophenoni]SOC39054.1 RND superfamily putative drug exporter [Ureibacillus acetophenoni]